MFYNWKFYSINFINLIKIITIIKVYQLLYGYWMEYLSVIISKEITRWKKTKPKWSHWTDIVNWAFFKTSLAIAVREGEKLYISSEI